MDTQTRLWWVFLGLALGFMVRSCMYQVDNTKYVSSDGDRVGPGDLVGQYVFPVDGIFSEKGGCAVGRTGLRVTVEESETGRFVTAQPWELVVDKTKSRECSLNENRYHVR